MDKQQYYQEYLTYCLFHCNPPSFSTWLLDKLREVERKINHTRQVKESLGL